VSGRGALPDLDFEPTREFWAAAQRRELAIPRCDDCDAFIWYPAPQCRHCNSAALTWTRTSGNATLFSWSVVTRALFKAYAEKAPYITGLVCLREDPAVRLVTLLVDCEPEALRADMPVHVVFRELGFPGVETKILAPMFTPVIGP
jgi:uncharacterized OB-fold protein